MTISSSLHQGETMIHCTIYSPIGGVKKHFDRFASGQFPLEVTLVWEGLRRKVKLYVSPEDNAHDGQNRETVMWFTLAMATALGDSGKEEYYSCYGHINAEVTASNVPCGDIWITTPPLLEGLLSA